MTRGHNYIVFVTETKMTPPGSEPKCSTRCLIHYIARACRNATYCRFLILHWYRTYNSAIPPFFIKLQEF